MLLAAGREVISKTSAYKLTKLSYRVEVRVEEEQKGNENIKIDGSVWIRPWINRRKEEGCFPTLFQELKREDSRTWVQRVYQNR